MNNLNIKKSWIYIGIIVLLVIIVWNGYNKIVKAEIDVKTQWGNVENVYQRRADLIPNLVNTVKGYANHEKETLEGIVNARAKATSVNVNPDKLDAASLQQFQQAQDGISSALSRLLMIVENYPDLKANQNFLELQAQLEGTENRITVERKKFNDLVGVFNKKIKTFPGVLINKLTGFEEKGVFKAKEGAENAPVVSFE